MSVEPIQIASEHPKTVPKGSGSSPEGSGTSQNHPGRSQNGREWSWKFLEASGSFHKFLDSTIGAKTPLALGARHPKGAGRNLEGFHPKEDCNPLWGRIPLVGGFLLEVGVP